MGNTITSVGWFDAQRVSEASNWYDDDYTLTPPISDYTTFLIVASFAIILSSFFLVMSRIRRRRCGSFLSVTFTLTVGALILVCIHHSCWHFAKVTAIAQQRSAFAVQTIDAELYINIGLHHASISLSSTTEKTDRSYATLSAAVELVDNGTISERNCAPSFNYHELFSFDETKSMRKQMNDALKKGLPDPILTIFDYLSFEDGFAWSRRYQQAGCFATAALWAAFLCWSVQVLVLIWLPRYFARMAGVVGALICFADVLFYALVVVKQDPLRIVLSTFTKSGHVALLEFRLGWCFYATLFAGICYIFIGILFGVLEVKSLYELKTFWQIGVDDDADLYDDDELLRLLEEDKELEFLPHPMMSRQISVNRKKSVMSIASRIFPQWFVTKEKSRGRKVGVVEIGFNPEDFILP
uniref:Uncharacterized protein n=1 Tax=Plectus sambesii TaxID=2011161 RepID=A0A914W1Y4_9BILA